MGKNTTPILPIIITGETTNHNGATENIKLSLVFHSRRKGGRALSGEEEEEGGRGRTRAREKKMMTNKKKEKKVREGIKADEGEERKSYHVHKEGSKKIN